MADKLLIASYLFSSKIHTEAQGQREKENSERGEGEKKKGRKKTEMRKESSQQ